MDSIIRSGRAGRMVRAWESDAPAGSSSTLKVGASASDNRKMPAAPTSKAVTPSAWETSGRQTVVGPRPALGAAHIAKLGSAPFSKLKTALGELGDNVSRGASVAPRGDGGGAIGSKSVVGAERRSHAATVV